MENSAPGVHAAFFRRRERSQRGVHCRRKPIRAIETSPGLLPYIWVDSISATLSVVRTAGGEVIAEPNPDEPGSPADIALFRDPAGNLIGLHQQR